MMATKIYQHDESAITWRNTGGTELFTPTSLGSNAGRQGAYHDLGTAARSRRFLWRAWLKPGSTRVVGEIVNVYLLTGDGTHYDNDDGTGDAAVSALDKLRNADPIGRIQIDENAAVEMGKGGDIDVVDRYCAPVFWNQSANALSSTAGDFGFDLVPVPDEQQ